MTGTSVEAAEADWLRISTPSTRPLLGRKGRPLDGVFREVDGIAIWIRWEAGAGWIKRFERTTYSPSRAAEAVLRRLQEISDRHSVPLRGNVAALETAECPGADQERLVNFYRRAGFSVGGPPIFILCYPPEI